MTGFLAGKLLFEGEFGEFKEIELKALYRGSSGWLLLVLYAKILLQISKVMLFISLFIAFKFAGVLPGKFD